MIIVCLAIVLTLFSGNKFIAQNSPVEFDLLQTLNSGVNWVAHGTVNDAEFQPGDNLYLQLDVVLNVPMMAETIFDILVQGDLLLKPLEIDGNLTATGLPIQSGAQYLALDSVVVPPQRIIRDGDQLRFSLLFEGQILEGLETGTYALAINGKAQINGGDLLLWEEQGMFLSGTSAEGASTYTQLPLTIQIGAQTEELEESPQSEVTGGDLFRIAKEEVVGELRILPTILAGVPFEAGDQFVPEVRLFPRVPGDVKIEITYASAQGELIDEVTISGTADETGYFRADPYTFTETGEYLIEYTSEFREAGSPSMAGSYQSFGVVSDDSSDLIAHGERGLHINDRFPQARFHTAVYPYDVPGTTAVVNFPYFSNDVIELPASGEYAVHPVITIQDTAEEYTDWLISQTPMENHEMIAEQDRMDSLPVAGGSYWYYSIVNSDGIIAQGILNGEDDALVISSDMLDESASIFGGAVIRIPEANIYETIPYSAQIEVSDGQDIIVSPMRELLVEDEVLEDSQPSESVAETAEATANPFETAESNTANLTLPETFGTQALKSGQGVLTRFGRYITVNKYHNSITISEPWQELIVREVPVGDFPTHVAITPDSTKVAVLNQGDTTVSVIGLNPIEIINTITLPNDAHAILAATNNDLLVASEDNRILQISMDTGEIVGRINLPVQPRELTSWGDFLFVTNEEDGILRVLSLTTGDISSEISLGNQAGLMGSVEIDTFNRKAYVPYSVINSGSATNTYDSTFLPYVAVIDLNTMMVEQQIPLMIADRPVSLPLDAVVDVTRQDLYVVNEGSSDISVIELETGLSKANVPVGAVPDNIQIRNDGTLLYVHNSGEDTISIIDPQWQYVRSSISTTSDTLPVLEQLGYQLFHDAQKAELTEGRLIACASCHLEGGSDQRTWNGVTTPAIRGNTRVLQADNQEMQSFLEAHIHELQFGSGFLASDDATTSIDLDALTAYLKVLAAK